MYLHFAEEIHVTSKLIIVDRRARKKLLYKVAFFYSQFHSQNKPPISGKYGLRNRIWSLKSSAVRKRLFSRPSLPNF